MNVRMLFHGPWVIALMLLLAGSALAHRVNVFAWVEGDTVFVESKYPDGTAVHAGVIRVLDSTGKELLSGKTNERGEFSFKIPEPDDLSIVLEAGMGHRADWPLLKQDSSPAGEVPKSEATARTPEAPPALPKEAAAAAAASPLTANLELAIEKALDKKLAPVMKQLAELHEPKVRLSDVLGGLGYILGLVGVAAYFKRKSG